MGATGAGEIRAGLASPNAPVADAGGTGGATFATFKLPRHHGQPLITGPP